MSSTSRKPTDLDNAKALEAYIGSANLLKGPPGIYRFDGLIWRPLSDDELQAIALPVLEQLPTPANAAPLKNMVRVFKSLNRQNKVEFDLGDPNLLVLADGYYEFKSGQWTKIKPQPDLHRRIKLAFTYTSQEPIEFEKFLDSILCDANGEPLADAAELKKLIYEMIGYALVGHAKWEKFFILHGPGANGKSILTDVIRHVVGPENAASVQLSQMANTFQRSHIDGKLVNLLTELEENEAVVAGVLKALASGDTMTVEKKHQDPREMTPFATVIAATNHLPYIKDHSDGTSRRAVIIPLMRQFLGGEQDTGLRDRLIAERDAIGSRAMQALGRLIANGGKFTSCATTAQALAEWLGTNDTIRQFVDDCLKASQKETVTQQDAYAEYLRWHMRGGRRGQPVSERNFGQRLQAAGVTTTRRKNGNVLPGMRLEETPELRLVKS